MTSERVRRMTRKERSWWLNRLNKQFKKEAEMIEKSHKKKPRSKFSNKYGV